MRNSLDHELKQNISSFIARKRKSRHRKERGRRKGLATRGLSFPASLGSKKNAEGERGREREGERRKKREGSREIMSRDLVLRLSPSLDLNPGF